MKAFNLILVFAVSLVVAGCSSVTVTNDYDREANFAAMKTFDWITAAQNVVTPDAASASFENQLIEKHMKRAVSASLTEKGLTQSSMNPDLYIAYNTGTQQKVSVTDYGTGYGYGRWGTMGGVNVQQYTQGTIILDLIDAKTKQLVWRSVASGALAARPDPSQAEQKINDVVQRMLEDYPPKPGK